MGRLRRSRTHSNPKKNQAPGQKTRRYKRDIDQILDDLKDGGASKIHDELLKKDLEELPGMAQHGCLTCSRYFATPIALVTHTRSKPHKRRLKTLEEEPYTIEESQRAAGVGVDNGIRQNRGVGVGDAMQGLEEEKEKRMGKSNTGGVRALVESAVGVVGDALLKLVGPSSS